MKSISKTFYLFTFALISILFIPELLMHGMFFDGITYATLARNLADGLGTFWIPFYTEEIYPQFHEHPPLAIGLQSLFFKLFGDHFYIEKIYSFLLLLLTFWGLYKLWSMEEKRKDAWIPMILMLTIPIVIWSFRNNMLENTVVVFTTFSTFFYVNFSKSKSVLNLFLGSLCVIAAFLSKGAVGLFPIAAPLIYVLFQSKFRLQSLIISYAKVISSLVILTFAIHLIFPECITAIIEYFNQQLLPALTNEREITTTYRLKIITDLLMQLIFPVVFFLLTLISKNNRILKWNREILFYLLMGIAASFPLVISLKQSSFYLLPSIPFYIIALSLLFKPIIYRGLNLIKSVGSKIVSILSFLLIIVSFALCFINFDSYARDELMIKDVQNGTSQIPANTVVSTSKNTVCHNWTLVAYMMRYAKVSIDCETETEYEILEINGRYEIRDRIRE